MVDIIDWYNVGAEDAERSAAAAYQLQKQQYEQLAADNTLLRQQLDALKLKNRDISTIQPLLESPRQIQYQELLNQCDSQLLTIRSLEVELDQKGGALLFLQNQLREVRSRMQEEQSKQQNVFILNSQRIVELQDALGHKDRTVSELTEYMEVQAGRIEELTKEGMAAIENYQFKLAQKDKIIQQLSQDNQRQMNQVEDNDRPIAITLKEGIDNQRLKDLEALLALKEQSVAELSEFMQLQSQKIANLESQLSDSKISDLQEQIVSSNQIILSKEQSITELGQFLSILTNKCQQFDGKRSQYEKSIEQAESRAIRAEQQSKKLSLQILDLGIKLQKTLEESKNEKLQFYINEVQVKLSTKEDQLEHAKLIIFEKQQQIKQYVDRINNLEEQMTQIQATKRVGANNQSSQKRTEQMRQNGNQIAGIDQQSQIIVFSQKIQELELILMNKEESLAQLTAYLEQNQIKMGKLQEDKQKLISQNEQLRTLTQTIEQCSLQLKQKNDQNTHSALVKQLQTRLQEMEAITVQKEQLKLRLSERDEMLDHLRTKFCQKEQESMRLSLELSARSQEKIECGMNCQRYASLVESQKQLQNLESIITAKSQTIADLSEFMNDQANRIQQLQSRAGDNKEDHCVSQNQVIQNKQENQKVHDKLSQLESVFLEKLGQKDITIAQFSECISQKTNKIKELQEQIGKLVQQQKNLSQHVAELERQKDYVHDINDKIKGQYESLNRQLQMCKQTIERYSKSNLQEVENNDEEALLKQKIEQLQGVVQSKTDMIMELSEFMNSQAARLQQLQAKSIAVDQNKFPKDEKEGEKIHQLLSIIASKELSITELTQYLHQNLSKICQLQAQLAQRINTSSVGGSNLSISSQKDNVVKEGSIQMLKKEQEFESLMADFNKLETQKKELLMELEAVIQLKHLQLQNIKTDVAQKNQNLQQLADMIKKIQNQIMKLTSDKQKMSKAKVEMLEEIKNIREQKKHVEQLVEELMHQVQQIQTKLEHTEVVDQSQTKIQIDWKTLIKEKEDQANSLTEILQNLQVELRNKDDIIRQLERKGTQPESQQKQSDSNQQNKKFINQLIENQKSSILELTAENHQLNQKVQYLLNKINNLEKVIVSQKEQDLQVLQNQLQNQTEKHAEDYRNELQEFKQLNYDTVDKQVISEQDDHSINEKVLTASQILAQLLVYSDGRNNFKKIRHLLISLNQVYRNEFQAYERDNKDLREAVDSLIELREVIDQQQRDMSLQHEQIVQLNKQIKQKNQLIEELQQLNQQKQKSFNDKLQGIRQSVNIFGDQTPFTLSKLMEHPQEANALNFNSQGQRDQEKDKKEIAKLKEQIRELKIELQHAKRQIQEKARQIQQIRVVKQKQPTFEREFDQLLQDSHSNINIEHAQEQEYVERLQSQKLQLVVRCQQYQSKLKSLEQNNASMTENIQKLNKKLEEYQCEKQIISEQEGVNRKDSSRVEQIGEKVLVQLLQGRHGQDPPSSSCSGQRETLIGEELNEKNEIIGELQQTILKLQKGYNGEIMELRRNNAELNAEIINLRKRVYLYDPGAVDVAELIKDTCSPLFQDAQFFRPAYNLRYHRQYGQERHNLSSFTEQYPRRQYQPYYSPTQPTLGEKMMGRRCRGAYPVNLTINNQFRLNASAWAQNQ